MKKILVLLVLLTVASFARAQAADSYQEKMGKFDRLIFEVQSNKQRYLPFEPIFMKFKLLNPSSEAMTVDRPSFLLHSTAGISTPTGEIVKVGSLSLSSGGGPNLPGGVNQLRPGQSYEEENAPAFDPDIFSKPGIYEIQFFLNGFASNKVKLEIVSPEGIDRSAYEFLNAYGRDIWFGRMLQEKDGSKLLRIFVERYGESNYGVYAIASLAKYYLFFEKDLDRAKREFDKIKANENEIIAKQARKSIADIAIRKAELERAKLPK